MSISDDQKEIVLLSIVNAMGGNADAGDERWHWMQWFCTDETDAKTFNRCVDKGWLRSTHDSDTDHSVAWITDEGITALTDAAAKVRAIREGDGEWVMVPREPTEAMSASGADRIDGDMNKADRVYRAMIAASPIPATGGEKE